MAKIIDESSVDHDLTALQSAFVMGDEEMISNLAAKYQSFLSSLTLVRIKPDSFHVDSLATALLDDDIERNVLLVESVAEGTKAFAVRQVHALYLHLKQTYNTLTKSEASHWTTFVAPLDLFLNAQKDLYEELSQEPSVVTCITGGWYPP